MGSLVQDVTAEYKANKWFRLTTIGGILTITATLIFFVGVFVGVGVSTMQAVVAFGVLALNVAFVALTMYQNYCVEHGRCTALASVFAINAVVIGGFSLVFSIVGAWLAWRRGPDLMMQLSPRRRR